MMTQTPTDALRLVPASVLKPFETIAKVDEKLDDGETTIVNISRIRDLVNAAAPASPMPGGGWRTDFENAPKDGSVFMVGYDDEAARKGRLWKNSERVYEARWNDVKETWSARNGFILHSDATHWMPLPAAPTGDA